MVLGAVLVLFVALLRGGFREVDLGGEVEGEFGVVGWRGDVVHEFVAQVVEVSHDGVFL